MTIKLIKYPPKSAELKLEGRMDSTSVPAAQEALLLPGLEARARILSIIIAYLEPIRKLGRTRPVAIFSAILRRFPLPGDSPPAEKLLVWQKI